MVLRLREWNRRLVGLGAGLALAAIVGCSTTKEEHKPLSNSNEVSRTTMGPGNTVNPPTPLLPISNGSGTTVARNPDPSAAAYANGAPNMPQMPTGPNRVAVGASLQTPFNNGMNQANFGSYAPPAPSLSARPISISLRPVSTARARLMARRATRCAPI